MISAQHTIPGHVSTGPTTPVLTFPSSASSTTSASISTLNVKNIAKKSILKPSTSSFMDKTHKKNKKNVRFDLYSTTIKRFDSKDEPITISLESSPIMSPILFPVRTNCLRRHNNNGDSYYDLEGGDNEDDDSCWFNNLSVLPNLVKFDKKFNSIYKKSKSLPSHSHQPPSELESFYKENNLSLSDFDLDYEDEDELEDDDDLTLRLSDIDLDNFEDNNSNVDNADTNKYNNGHSGKYNNNGNMILDSNERLISDIDIKWKLVNTNIPVIPSNLNLMQNSSVKSFVNGQNIKLFKLEQNDDAAVSNNNNSTNKLHGYLIVNNLNFEKVIEIKFTFNNWNNIHYINATFNKTLTSQYDEFSFIIDLNRYKFFLQIKDLLNKQIKIDLCCRYDVNNETYFDNNNYQNYSLRLNKVVNNNDAFSITDSRNNKILPFLDTLSSLPSSLSSSSSSPSPPPTSLEGLPSPPSLTTLQKNSYTSYYMSNVNSLSMDSKNNKQNIQPIGVSSNSTPSKPSATNSFNMNRFMTPMTTNQFLRNRGGNARTFSDDTDYFNTSPLKHLYHNDTCEFIRKPATINEVLNIETSPAPLPDLLPAPSIAATKSSINIFGSLSQQSSPEPQLPNIPSHSIDNKKEQKMTKLSTNNRSTTAAVSTSDKNNNNGVIRSQQNIKDKSQKQSITPLEERSLSATSLSSTDSAASFSSFQSDNISAKRKNDSLTSSTSSDSTIPNISIPLKMSNLQKHPVTESSNNEKVISNVNDSFSNSVNLTSTNLQENNNKNNNSSSNKTTSNEIDYLSSFISRRNGNFSSNSSLTNNNEDALFNMKHPTLDYFNRTLTASPSLNSNYTDVQQDEVQSIETDTTFKNNNCAGTNNNTTITMPIPKSVSFSDKTKNINNLIDNSEKYIPTKKLFHNNPQHDNINNKQLQLSENKDNTKNSVLQDNSVRNMDYQTLLHSYCFYTSSPSNSDSTSKRTEISPSSSPSKTLFL